MSQENVEIVRRGHEAFNRDDLSVISELATPDVEWGATGAFPGVDAGYRGPEAIREWGDLIRSEWEEFEVSLDEILHDENDLIVVAERLRGRGRGSGVEVEMRVFSAYWVEEGKIKRRAAFTDRVEALEVAGLSE